MGLTHGGWFCLPAGPGRVGGIHGPADGSVARQFETLADLQRKGVIRHIGLSNVTSAQLAECRAIAPVVCVQNAYNVALRADMAIEWNAVELRVTNAPDANAFIRREYRASF